MIGVILAPGGSTSALAAALGRELRHYMRSGAGNPAGLVAVGLILGMTALGRRLVRVYLGDQTRVLLLKSKKGDAGLLFARCQRDVDFTQPRFRFDRN